MEDVECDELNPQLKALVRKHSPVASWKGTCHDQYGPRTVDFQISDLCLPCRKYTEQILLRSRTCI